MLLRFRVGNYASIRDELELSLVAATDHTDIAVKPVADSGLAVLPAAAIYGANASGKSNVISALVFMRNAVRESHQKWRPGAPIRRNYFKLEAVARQRPTTFGIDFIERDVHYEYGFSVDDSRVLTEWLYSFPKKRRRVLFERGDDGEFQFGATLGGQRERIAQLTRPNSLYLSAAAANNHPVLSRIYEWFSDGIHSVQSGTNLVRSYTLHAWQTGDRVPLLDLLHYADTGVLDVEIAETEFPQLAADKFQELLGILDPDGSGTGSFDVEPLVEFLHRGSDGDARLTMREESSGTLAWFKLVGPVESALRCGGVLVVDEVDAYLHPLLSAHLVGLFQDPQINRTGAQLLFNTHNVSLLGPAVPWRLRRDQVWFTEKDGESGATALVGLSEYRVRDGLENVEKRYLGGRYGAIPFLDDKVLASLRAE